MDTTKVRKVRKAYPLERKHMLQSIITFLMSIIGFVEVQKIDTGLGGYDRRGFISD